MASTMITVCFNGFRLAAQNADGHSAVRAFKKSTSVATGGRDDDRCLMPSARFKSLTLTPSMSQLIPHRAINEYFIVK